MTTTRLGFAFALLLAAGCQGGIVGADSNEGSSSQGLMRELEQVFLPGRFEVSRLDERAMRDAVARDHKLAVTTNRGTHQLITELHDLRGSRYHAADTGPEGDRAIARAEAQTYKGEVLGDGASQVRLALVEGGVEGYFTVGDERIYIQTARRFAPHSARPGDLVTYVDGALRPELAQPIDSVPEMIQSGAGLVPGGGTPPIGEVTLRVLEVATESALSFVTEKGGPEAANAAALNVLNMAEGVYEAELGITFDVTYQHTWSTPDPFVGSDRALVLAAFRTNWQGVLEPRDVAQLFTNDPVVAGGVAYIGVTCAVPAYAYSVVGRVFTEAQRFVVSAHEIGHTLGANHRETNANPALDCNNSIMNASVGTPYLTFCEPSRQDIRGYVAANGACLATRESCTPKTCAQASASCGAIPDGCGGTLQCGSCAAPQSCGGGGTPNVCGAPTSPPVFQIEQWGQSGDVPLAGNFFGGAAAELALFRPSELLWYMHEVGNYSSARYFGWGFASDQPIIVRGVAGHDLLSQFRDSDGYWYTYDADAGQQQIRRFGQSGDLPVSGNFRGLGADLAVYRPSAGTFYMIDYAGTSFTTQAVAGVGTVERLFAGDFLGTGRDQVAFYSGGQWTIADMVTGARQTVGWGQGGDTPFVGRILSANRATLGVFRAQGSGAGTIYLKEVGGSSSVFPYGQGGDVPLAGDYLGRGKDQLVQWRPSTGEWFIYLGL